MSLTLDGSSSVTINSGAILGITSGTAVASTSGTSIDFTSIPSWVKRITVMFNGVSTSGTSVIVAQLGKSGGVETTGYNAAVGIIATINNTTRLSAATTYFPITWASANTDLNYGSMVFANLSGNIWTATGLFLQDQTAGNYHQIMTSGAKTLAGTLDRVRITTAGGTDTFDAGSINILYE